ncbi:MAG: hypothetical protein AABY22_19760, partial [Nanoarchaeota archaeon]
MKNNRLPPKVWNKIRYVEFAEIKKFHGNKWFKKFLKDFGVQTCPVIEDGKASEFGSCYYSDYIKSANKIDYNKSYL